MNQIEIGGNILAGRKARGLSQSELADILCISKQAVGKWERGESLPDVMMLARIARVFEVDMNYFFSGTSLAFDGTTTRPTPPQIESAHHEHDEDDEGWLDSLDNLDSNKVFNMSLFGLSINIGSNKKDMSYMNLHDADLSGLCELSEKLKCANIERCKFIKADLSGVKLSASNLKNNDFGMACFDGGQFKGENIIANSFCQASFRNFEFKACNVCGNNFGSATLDGVLFSSTNLENNALEGTQLANTKFQHCNLKKLRFCTTLTNCSFISCNFSSVSFQNATLQNVFFKSKAKKITFLDCKMDKITYAFLKSAKADLSKVEIIE